MATASSKLSIEELIERLESIAASIENPDTGLERSISLYEEGLKIAESCKKRLLEARNKIETINPELVKETKNTQQTGTLFDEEG